MNQKDINEPINDDTLLEFSPIEDIDDLSSKFNNPQEKPKEESVININQIVSTPPAEKELPINDIIQNSAPKLEETIIEPITSFVNNDKEELNNNSAPLNNENNMLEILPKEEIKSQSKNKLGKYAVALPLIAFLSTLFLGAYIFTSNTRADTANLIRIEKNNKVGYINSNGELVVNPKYTTGTDYYKGYAIVKNQNNLYGVIDNADSFASPFGNFFSIERFSNRYVVSKFTSKGLKQALLDSNFDELTKYKYDNITYAKDNTFVFVRENTMGILNSSGKEIYTYESNDVDDKNISIETSKITSDDTKTSYARIKLNDSSTIVNINSGKEIYKYTLDEINVLDNNVFYIKSTSDGINNRYLVIKDDKVVYQTFNYKRVRVDDYGSNVVIGVKDDLSCDYIDLNTKKIINENTSFEFTYGDGIILKKDSDSSENEDVYEIIKNGKTISTVKDINPVTGEFKNGFLKIYVDDNKYNFIDTSGKLVNDEKYDSITNFNLYGYSIVSKDGSYGIIDKKGNTIIPIKYNKIEFLDSDLFKTIKNKYKKELFIYTLNDQKGIINKNDDTMIKAIYNDFEYITTKYPMIIGKCEDEDILINLDSNKEYSINIYENPVIFSDYFIVGSKYYNYEGKKIFDTTGEE